MISPLTQDQFRDAIRKGRGRAIQHLRRYPEQPYPEEIIHACTHNTAFDPQLEGGRITFLRRVIAISNFPAQVREAILHELASTTNRRDAEQMFSLAMSYAIRGDQEARQSIYDKFDAFSTANRYVGADDLIAIDGVEGFLHAAQRVGVDVLCGAYTDGAWFVDAVMDHCQEKTQCAAALQEAAVRDPAIHAYLDLIRTEVEMRERRSNEREQRRNRPRLSLDELLVELASIRPGLTWSTCYFWTRDATAEERIRAAERINQETNRDRLLELLELFGRSVSFPLEPDRLIALAGSDDSELAFRAIVALGMLKHARVRSLFFDLMTARRHLDIAFSLLEENFVDGDAEFVLNWLAQEGRDAGAALKPAETHGIGQALRSIVLDMDKADAATAMCWHFDSTPCSFCRTQALERLLQIGVASGNLLRECLHDSHRDTRQLAVQTLRKRRANDVGTAP